MTTISNLILKIQFGHSSSQNYYIAVQKAQGADYYSSTGEGRTIMHTCSYHFQNFNQFQFLLEITKNWASCSIEVAGMPIPKNNLYKLKGVYECFSKAQVLPNPEVHCRDYDLRFQQHRNSPPDETQRYLTQCNFLKIVRHSAKWYDYGYFNHDGEWVIDKEHIKKFFENEIALTRADICPFFDQEKIEAAIKGIPEKVNPQEMGAWDYKYDYTKQVIGVVFRGEKTECEEAIKIADKVIQFRPRRER